MYRLVLFYIVNVREDKLHNTLVILPIAADILCGNKEKMILG